MKNILPVFSYLFHPIFVPVFGTAMWLLWGSNYFGMKQQFLILLQVAIITIFIPLAFFYLLKMLGKVDSIMISDLSQRKIPLTLQIILMLLLLRESITIDRFPELFFFFAGGILSAFLALALLFAGIKASLHMTGISALTVFAIALSLYHQINLMHVIAFLILMNGIIAASRLQMKAHGFRELTIGFLTGTIPQLAVLYFWL